MRKARNVGRWKGGRGRVKKGPGEGAGGWMKCVYAEGVGQGGLQR